MFEFTTVIVSAVRTAVGSFNGSLSQIPAPRLGGVVISEALKRAQLSGNEVSEVIMGCVLTAGVGQAPARQASLCAGIPHSIPCVTIGKVCGSGLKAVALARQAILSGDADIVVSGGMENMSLAPHLLERARHGYRLGHAQISDSMIKDGLWDVTHQFHMGNAAEMCVKKYRFSREVQDQFAIESYRRAIEAQRTGAFKTEIVPVPTPSKEGSIMVDQDEEPLRFQKDKIALLKPVFDPKTGTVTAANASKINDGASALVVMEETLARKKGLAPLARIVSYAETSQEPEWFTTAPIKAITQALKKAKLTTRDIDLFEINEAFAAVALVAIQELKLDARKVNVNGGAVALGHPIGASGARILTTLLHAMQVRNARTGLASLCIGGGEANAMIVERL